MEFVNLLDICNVYQPKTISTKYFIENGEYNVYGANGIIGKYDEYNHKDSEILMACRGASCGAINVSKPYSWINGNAMVVSPKDTKDVNKTYLKYMLMSVPKGKIISGTAQPQITRQNLSKFKVPLCSLEEQKRIVSRIEELFSELDNGVENLKKVKAQLDIYRQAVLKEAFEGINDFVELKDICERIYDGPFGSNLKTADYSEDGIRVVRLENIKYGWFDDSKKSFVREEKYETIKKHTVYAGMLIMSTFISGSVKICLLPNQIKYAVNKADCIGIKVKDNVLTKYILYYMLTQNVYRKLENSIHGATRPRVNTTQIKKIEIPIVSMREQKKIVNQIESRLSACENIEKTINTALQQAETMRQSILKQAFEGKL